jgi:hypothetical protein
VAEENAGEDRYPDIREVLQDVLNDPDFPEGPVDRIDIMCLGTGEATYRVWPAHSDEHLSGYRRGTGLD